MTFSLDDKDLILVYREYIKIWNIKLGECKKASPNFFHAYPMSYSPDKKFVALRKLFKRSVGVVDVSSGLSVCEVEMFDIQSGEVCQTAR